MKSWLVTSLYSILGLLFLSGAGWLILHWFFQVPTQFGSAPHPLQPGILIVHGVLGIVAVFLVGWVAGAHVVTNWARKVSRGSGIAMIATLAILTVTGFGIYYLTAELVARVDAFVHEIVGLAGILPALIHWLPNRRAPKLRRP